MFHVGQMVVCVDDRPCRNGLFGVDDSLTKRCVYTVRAIKSLDGLQMLPGHESSPYGLCLEEIVRPYDTPYGAARFRPVAKTDISIFQSMLAPKQKELVHE